MNRKFTSAILSLAMIQTNCAVFSANASPDFEMSGWTVTPAESAEFDFDTYTDGVTSLKSLIKKGETVKIKAVIDSVDASTDYDFSFYVKAENADSCKVVRDVLYKTDFNPGTDWAKETVSFTSRSNGTLSIQFEFKNTGEEDMIVWLDQCSLSKSGEENNILVNGGFDEGVDVTAPLPVTDVSFETGDRNCLLLWTDSKSSDGKIVKIYRDGEVIAEVPKGTEEYLIENIENGAEYTYVLVVSDDWNNESEPVEITFVPNIQREAPGVVADDDNDVIVGIDDTMEYCMDGGEWIKYSPGEEPDLSGCHIVYVRYCADGEIRESKKATLIFYEKEEVVEGDITGTVEMGIRSVTVKGTSTDSVVTVAISPKDSELYADIVFAGELDVTDGKFEAVFVMPDYAERGSYTMVAASENADDAVMVDFSYVPETVIQDFASGLPALDEHGIEDALRAPENKDILESVGIDTDDFYGISDYSGLAEVIIAESELTAEDLSEYCGTYTAFDLLEKADKAAEAVQILDKYSKYMNLSFGDVSWDETENGELKAWIASQVLREFDTTDEIKEAYMFANVYYLVNQASYDSLEKVMEKYSSEMELDDCDAYSDFLGLSSSKRKKALKEVKLAVSEYTNNDDFKDELEKAVEKVQKQESSSSGGGGGGGGSSSGKTGFASLTSTPVQITTETKAEKTEIVILRDVDKDHWAKDAIEALYNKGILSGMGDGTFNPDGSVTREQLAKIICESFEFNTSPETASFTDVGEDRWSYPYIVLMKSAGVINGYEDGSFRPSAEITREDMAVMLCRACDAAGIKLEDKRAFADFDDDGEISGYAYESISRLYISGIMNGTGEKIISPKGRATRAMAAKLIYLLTGGVEE